MELNKQFNEWQMLLYIIAACTMKDIISAE